jgi:hypothetical protein
MAAVAVGGTNQMVSNVEEAVVLGPRLAEELELDVQLEHEYLELLIAIDLSGGLLPLAVPFARAISRFELDIAILRKKEKN